MIGKIYISGLIGTFEDEKGVELIDVISQVKKQPEATSFEVYINSQGGVVQTGYDIHDYIKSLGLPITTIGSGMVASIATVIFMAGSKRLVRPNTEFMIHLPMGGIEFATADEMDSHSKVLRDVENRIVQFYSRELNLNKEAIAPLLKNETWLNESQLIDLGFVTSELPMKISARAIITNKSKIKTMSKTNNLKSILNKILGTVVNKVVFTADNKEIVFPDLESDDVVEIGARATIDGVPAEGEVVNADGDTYVFAAGVLTEIRKEVVEEEVTEEDMIDALIASLEFASQLDERLGVMETEFTGMKKERDEVNAKLAKAEETIAKLKGSSKSPEQIKKEKDQGRGTVSSVVTNWRNNKNKKK